MNQEEKKPRVIIIGDDIHARMSAEHLTKSGMFEVAYVPMSDVYSGKTADLVIIDDLSGMIDVTHVRNMNDRFMQISEEAHALLRANTRGNGKSILLNQLMSEMFNETILNMPTPAVCAAEPVSKKAQWKTERQWYKRK